MDPRRAPRSVSVTITGLLVGLASFLGLVYTAFGVVDAGVPRMVVLGLSLVVAALVVFLVTTGGGRAARFAVASTIVLLAMAVTVYVAVQKPVQDDSAERPPAPSHLTSCGTLEDGRSVSGGWGPDRELFTIASPAPYPVMNSITDNPVVGDERAFFLVKQSVDQEDGGWCSSARVRDGDVLE